MFSAKEVIFFFLPSSLAGDGGNFLPLHLATTLPVPFSCKPYPLRLLKGRMKNTGHGLSEMQVLHGIFNWGLLIAIMEELL